MTLSNSGSGFQLGDGKVDNPVIIPGQVHIITRGMAVNDPLTAVLGTRFSAQQLANALIIVDYTGAGNTGGIILPSADELDEAFPSIQVGCGFEFHVISANVGNPDFSITINPTNVGNGINTTARIGNPTLQLRPLVGNPSSIQSAATAFRVVRVNGYPISNIDRVPGAGNDGSRVRWLFIRMN